MKNTLLEVKSEPIKNNSFLTEKSIRNMDTQELSVEIQKNIKIWENIASQSNFYQMKLVVGSSALRDCGVNHVGFKIQIPSTVFGDLYENFMWTFDIEGNTDTTKLHSFVYEKSLEIENKQSNDFEISLNGIRMHSLFILEDYMRDIFNLIDQQLNYCSEEKALLLTSLAFYEMETLSSLRKEDYLLYNDMYDLSNINDRWIACMNVKANYIKPTIGYLPHLVH